MQQHKYFYERGLPHYQPLESLFFVTYRLYGSIPLIKIAELKKEYRLIKAKSILTAPEESKRLQALYFRKFDEQLDNSLNEPYWLKQDSIAKIVSDSLHFNDDKEYKLLCYCIMPNHVHLVIATMEQSIPLYAIMQKHKRFTAWQCNVTLKRTGSFWQHESYDHIIKSDKELYNIVGYTLNNPVKAGFTAHWKSWKWNYLKKDLVSLFEE